MTTIPVRKVAIKEWKFEDGEDYDIVAIDSRGKKYGLLKDDDLSNYCEEKGMFFTNEEDQSTDGWQTWKTIQLEQSQFDYDAFEDAICTKMITTFLNQCGCIEDYIIE